MKGGESERWGKGIVARVKGGEVKAGEVKGEESEREGWWFILHSVGNIGMSSRHSSRGQKKKEKLKFGGKKESFIFF